MVTYSLHVAALVIVVLVIGAVIGVAGVEYFNLTRPTVSQASNSTTTTNGGGGNAQSAVSVSMPSGVGSSQSLNYQPTTVTVAKGGSVTWTNNDPVHHTVTSTSVPSGAQSFDSKDMAQGATFKVTFTVDGTYKYVCTYHPWMQGTVTVTG